MINFTDASMLGALDTKFGQQYNYLIELLTRFLSRGNISNVDGASYFNLENGTFNFQKDANNYMRYDGTNFEIKGTVTITGGTVVHSTFSDTPTTPYIIGDIWLQGSTGDIMECIVARTASESYNAADWAVAVKYTDDTTANLKKRVFVATPTVPYDIGDLWAQGSTGDLYKCITAKTSAQAYSVADWELATKYDNTQTVIDGGLITTGTLQVVNSGTVAAGVTGEDTGDTGVRFFAGDTFANRAIAPFRVLQDGTIYATNAQLIGSATASTAIGVNASASETNSIAIGNTAIATGNGATSVGMNSLSEDTAATAIGFYTWAENASCTAIGATSEAHTAGATAVGYHSIASGQDSLALGQGATASGNYSTAIGEDSSATIDSTIVLGRTGATAPTVIIPSGQIKFPATQNASTDVNTLDDYEESTSYTPTVTATAGTFTTVSATSRYVKVGKIVFIRYHVVITNKGTASGGVVITLPFNAAAEYYTGNGVEIASTVSNLFCYTIGSDAARIYRYDGASMITNGYQLVGTLVYEATA